MAFSHKLHNPTPYSVEINFHAGITIVVEPDSSTDLTTKQMEQFMPGEPGSEEIKSMLDAYGVFLENTDRDYDTQALKCLRACHRYQKNRFDEAVAQLSNTHTAMGIEAKPEAPAFRQKMQSMGLIALEERVGKLQGRINIYSAVVEEAPDELVARGHVFDPERTIFAMQPPREFKSKIAMEVFLSENPDVAAKHNTTGVGGTLPVEVDPVPAPVSDSSEAMSDLTPPVVPQLDEDQMKRFQG